MLLLAKVWQNNTVVLVFLDGKLWAEIDSGQYTPIVLPPGTYEIGVEPMGICGEDYSR
jgi:hypothetical protein